MRGKTGANFGKIAVFFVILSTFFRAYAFFDSAIEKPEIIMEKKGDSDILLTITFELPHDLHLTADATELAFEKLENISLKDIVYPEKKPLYLPWADENMDIYEGTFSIRAYLEKETEKILASGYFRMDFQGCSQDMCFRPQQLFWKFRQDKNGVYAFSEISENDFLAVYPLSAGTQDQEKGLAFAKIKENGLAQGAENREKGLAFAKTNENQPTLRGGNRPKGQVIDDLGDSDDANLTENEIIEAKENWFWRILSAFGFGILISLTPCVYPMVPITAAIISGGDRENTPFAVALSRSLIYVLGLSISYAILGIVSATAGASFAALLKSPVVLVPLSLVFIALGLSMFDLFTLQMPSFIMSRLQGKGADGGYFGVFLMGALAAMVATPCVAAPLAGILVYISTTGNIWLGFWSLFALAWGLGLILILAGTLSGGLMPRGGMWMIKIKHALAFIMFWAGAWILLPVTGDPVYRLISGIILVFAVIYLGFLDALTRDSSLISRFNYALGIILIFFSLLLVGPALLELGIISVPALIDCDFISHPVELRGDRPTLRPKNTAEFDALLMENKPVLIDFWAPWCTVCKKLEKEIFKDPAIIKALEDFNFIMVNIDDFPDLAERYQLPGIPSLIFHDSKGEYLRDKSIFGDIGVAQLEKRIKEID